VVSVNNTMLVNYASPIVAMALSASPAILILPHSTHNKHHQKCITILSNFIVKHFSPLYLALIFVALCGAELITSFSLGYFVRLGRGPPRISQRISLTFK
jgi:formate/nitrite transporter FocA (FNT family)